MLTNQNVNVPYLRHIDARTTSFYHWEGSSEHVLPPSKYLHHCFYHISSARGAEGSFNMFILRIAYVNGSQSY